MDCRLYQEKCLIRAAEELGQWQELAFFYAASGQSEQLKTMLVRHAANPSIQRFAHLLLLDDQMIVSDASLAPILEGNDPWFMYAAVKSLLRRSHIEQAANCVRLRSETYPTELTAINLVGKFSLHQAQWAIAREMCALSLHLAPFQEDVVQMQRMALGCEPYPHPCCLEMFPQSFRLAFYIPVYNVERYVAGALDGVFTQSYPLSEVLVVNDGTQDSSMDIVRKYPVTLVEHECNQGLAAARNTAFRHATAEYVGSVDSDAYPDLCFSRLLMMEFENAVDTLAGMGGNLIEQYQQEPPDRWRARHLAQQGTLAVRNTCIPFLYGSNTIFKRNEVLGIGGYDPQYRTNNEDVDLCRRLRAAGKLLLHVPDAKAWHLRRDSIASVMRMRWNWMQWHYREDEKFQDEKSYVQYFRDMQGQMIQLMERDIADGEYDLLYLDFLMYFYDLCCGINYGVESGVFSAADGRGMQLHLLANIQILDRTHGGQLRIKMAQDLVHVFQPSTAGNEMTPGFGELFAPFLTDLRTFLASIHETLYKAML